jgi:hypothetical protein
MRMRLQEMIDLRDDIGVWICPSTKRQVRHSLADLLAQLPRMFDAPCRPDALVPSEHHECFEAMIARAIGVRETVLNRMLARHERDDAGPRHVDAKIDDQVPQVILFLGTDSAVGEKHKRTGTCQAANRVVSVDPGVAARRGFELGAGRPKLCGNNPRIRSQLVEKRVH